MRDELQGIENTPAVTERRAFPRLRPTSLIYIDIGKVNGGIVTSLSENGLAFTAAATLRKGQLADGSLRMRIQFPGIPEAVEASGEIVWTSSSGKEARVQFVELEDKAREQIQTWISDQTAINGLRAESPALPNMRLPNSSGAKARGPRFSFADVASSRVDSEGETETEIEEAPEITREVGELPPLQAQGLTFADATEVVASTFESSAFTEDPAERTQTPRNEKAPQATPDEKQPRQPSLSIPERRQHARRQILLFTYAVLGEDNGGLVFNLGEGGFALTAAAALEEHHFAKIRVRFPDSEDWIETSGRLAWKNDSGKEAGIEFASPPEDVRARIRAWVSQEEPAPDLRSSEHEARANQGQGHMQGLPSLMELEGSPAEPFEFPAGFEEQPFDDHTFEEQRFEKPTKTRAAFSSALFKTGIKGILETASVRKRVAEIKLPRVADLPTRPGTRVSRKALAIAAGVALGVGGWMFLQRGSLNEAIGVIAQNVPNPQAPHEAAQEPEVTKTSASAAPATEDPPVQPSEKATSQSTTAKPPLQQIENGSPSANTSGIAAESRNVVPDRTPGKKPRSEEAVVHVPPTNSMPSSLDRAQRTALSQRKQEAKPPQITASASAPPSGKELVENKSVPGTSPETKPAENKPVQVAQTLPTLNSNKETNTAPSTLNSNSPQPVAAPPADLVKEKPLVASKQPEPPVVARTPVVNVSFDPFPSIRMGKTKDSKKSHQGKSLEMGRLLARVDPVYPEEARQQGVEGTVRVHAIFNREGAVQNVIQVSGPPMLVPATMSAVRQWRYSLTILGGQAMETEEDVTVQFRLANSSSKN